jgi:hypothetical protein
MCEHCCLREIEVINCAFTGCRDCYAAYVKEYEDQIADET